MDNAQLSGDRDGGNKEAYGPMTANADAMKFKERMLNAMQILLLLLLGWI